MSQHVPKLVQKCKEIPNIGPKITSKWTLGTLLAQKRPKLVPGHPLPKRCVPNGNQKKCQDMISTLRNMTQHWPKTTPNWFQNYLKMSLGSPPGSKVAKVGPRTPSSQPPCTHLEPKWLPKGVNFEAKIESKIVLISRVEKVGDLEGPRVAKWTLQTSKIIENHWRGC